MPSGRHDHGTRIRLRCNCNRWQTCWKHSCREYAAQANSVLVIDARASIGTPLQCGELVPTNDEMRRLCPNVPDMDDLFQTPKHAISRTCDTMNIITPSGKSLSYDFEGLILNASLTMRH